MPGQRHRGSVLMLYMQDYHDQLLVDMGVNPRRKVSVPFAGDVMDSQRQGKGRRPTFTTAADPSQECLDPLLPFSSPYLPYFHDMSEPALCAFL